MLKRCEDTEERKKKKHVEAVIRTMHSHMPPTLKTNFSSRVL